MNWNQAIKEEKAMLLRIIALLLSLADLAEQASRGPQAACNLLFWILQPAADAASISLDFSPELNAAAVVHAGDSRLDMMHLAIRFRELACLLECQVKLAMPNVGAYGDWRDRLSYLVVKLVRISKAITVFDSPHPVFAPDTS